MRRCLALALAVLTASTSLTAPAAFADNRRDKNPPPHYEYWESRRDPPPGHEFHPRPQPNPHWDNRSTPPPNWSRDAWVLRRTWLERHGHDHNDFDSAVGIVAGVILGFALGAAVVDSQQQQAYATSRLNDPGWIAYCARRYASFDPYTGTYLGYDGLRHYCR